MRRLLARYHIVLGAYIVGGRWFGLTWTRFGIGVMVGTTTRMTQARPGVLVEQ